MATKPTPGGSDGTYGTELNAFLDVSLAADGKVKDGAVFSTSATPVGDAAVANVKYVDDRTDPVYVGGESHTFNGGLIIKHKTQTAATNTTGTVTFLTPFPNALLTVVIMWDDVGTFPGAVTSKHPTDSFDYHQATAVALTGFDWIAIGW